MTKPIIYTAPTADMPSRAAVADAVRRFHEVRESAPAVERTAVREATVGGSTPTTSGRMLIRLISAGWSLNGNLYPAEVLRRDGPQAWPAGTRCYVDHASDAEEQEHPSGSVKNLAAVLREDARWDEPSQSLLAEARLFEPWRGPLTDMAEADAIGMSIRAWVTGEEGERDGRTGFIVESIPQGRSVDFVTVPAAGGAVVSVLEAVGSKVSEAASLGGWLESRLHLALIQYADDMYGNGQLTREERIVLSTAIGDGLQAWTARVEADAPQLFQRDRWSEPDPDSASDPDPTTADAAEGDPAMAAESVTDMTSHAEPATTETPTEHEEEPVSGIQTGAPPEQAGTATVPDNETPHPTTEAVAPAAVAAQPTAEAIAAIVAAAVREATGPLTAQIADLSARESARDAATRDVRNREVATSAVLEALQSADHGDVRESIRARVTARVTGAVPTTAEGAIDTSRLGDLITTVVTDEATHVRRERANALAEAGVGLPYGMGGAPVEESPDDGLEEELGSLFKNLGMSDTASKIAAEGRS